MGQLDNKVAVITGGGRGIGQAIALRYAAEGATVVISSRTQADLDATIAEAGLGSDRALAVVADAMDREDARRPVREAIDRFGRVDILVNNVGGTVGGKPDPFAGDDATFEQTLVLSLTSAWWTTSAALPGMRDQGSGGSSASARARRRSPAAHCRTRRQSTHWSASPRSWPRPRRLTASTSTCSAPA